MALHQLHATEALGHVQYSTVHLEEYEDRYESDVNGYCG